MIRAALGWLEHGAIWVGLGAASVLGAGLFLADSASLTTSRQAWAPMAFACVATWMLYFFERWSERKRRDRINVPERARWIEAHAKPAKLATTCGIVLTVLAGYGLVFVSSLPGLARAGGLLATAAGLWFVAHRVPQAPNLLRATFKPLSVACGWSALAVLGGAPEFAVFVLVRVLWGAMVFDLRDEIGDRRYDLPTISTVYGSQAAHRVAWLVGGVGVVVPLLLNLPAFLAAFAVAGLLAQLKWNRLANRDGLLAWGVDGEYLLYLPILVLA